MSQLNVTKDIRKLAEEAEKDNNLNSTVTTTAGLGLGSAYYANQTGAPKNTPPKGKLTPLQQEIAENDARNRQNAKNQGKPNPANPKPDPVNPKPNPANPKPEPEIKYKKDGSLDMRSKANRDAVRDLENLGKGKDNVLDNTPPKTDPKVKTKANFFPEFKGMPTGDDFKTFSPKKQAGNLFKIGGSLSRGMFDPRTFALFGGFEAGNLIGLDDLGENIGETIGDNLMTEDRLGLANFYANLTGGNDPRRPSRFVKGVNFLSDAYNTVTDVGGNIIEGTARLLPETADYIFSSNPQTDNVFKSAYGKAFDDEGTYVEPENKGMFLNNNQRQKPNPQINPQINPQVNPQSEKPSIPLEDRSEAELQIMRNQEEGRPLLSDAPANTNNNANVDSNIPAFQQEFLRAKEAGQPINNETLQKAQQFALNRGMVFDPETGFEKADFFGQMYKGQTVGEFLRGEDAPRIPNRSELRTTPFDNNRSTDQKEFVADITSDDPKKNPFVNGVRKRIKEEIGRNREIIENEDGSYTDAYIPTDIIEIGLKSPAQRTDKEVKRLARWSTSTQGKGMGGIAGVEKAIQGDQEMTPYQKESLKMRGDQFDKTFALQQEKFDQSTEMEERRLSETVRQYNDTVARGQDKKQADLLYKQVQTLSLLRDLNKEEDKEKLGFSLDGNVLSDFVDVLDQFGVSYDHENPGVYTSKGFMGYGKKQLTSEDLEQLKPLLGQTEFVQLLEYTSKQAQ
jgi:hypothetical protein